LYAAFYLLQSAFSADDIAHAAAGAPADVTSILRRDIAHGFLLPLDDDRMRQRILKIRTHREFWSYGRLAVALMGGLSFFSGSIRYGFRLLA